MEKYTGQVQVTIRFVTPEDAVAALSNMRNRSRSPSRVAGFAGAMRRGEWRLSPDAIAFTLDGMLLNGQHRLQAVIEVEIGQWFVVMRGLTQKDQDVMDYVRTRSFADQLGIHGEPYAGQLATAARTVWAYEQNGVCSPKRFTPPPSNPQLFATLDRHPLMRESISVGGTADRSHIMHVGKGTAMGLHYLFATASRDDADEFFARLKDGANLAKYNPILTLRTRLELERTRHQLLDQYVTAAWIITAWNYWRRGQQLKKLIFKPGGAGPDRFPGIDGCTVEIRGRKEAE